MKSLLVGIGRYHCIVYNYHDSRACDYEQSGILSKLDGLGEVWFVMYSLWKLCDNLCHFVDHTL
jgi:hypothetical protein